MNNYFVSYALKFKGAEMSPITHYDNAVIDLPHEVIDDTDIRDIQILVDKHYTDMYSKVLWFQKLPA
jgi:hypothetical protein